MKIEKQEFFIQSSGKGIYCLFEKPERAKDKIILLLHGLTNSHINCPLISESTESLHLKGFPTFRFDYFGSGKSDGEFKDKTWEIMVQNTINSLEYAKTKLKYSKIGVWGRSLGAILGATICDDPFVFASVFLSMTVHTNISFSASFPKGQPFSSPIKGTAIVKGEPILEKGFYEKTTWIDKLQKQHLSKAKNILIMQGTEDKTVYNPTWAKEIYDLVNKPKKLIYIKGANHGYTGFENKAIENGINWFRRWMSSKYSSSIRRVNLSADRQVAMSSVLK